MTDYIIKCIFSIVIVVFLSPWIIIIALISLCYLLRLRRKCLLVVRDTIRLKFSLMSPVNSLIQDAINGLPTLRSLKQKKYFQNLLYTFTDKQTSAHITSNGGHRWTALRIDIQAFIIATTFAFVAIFLKNRDRTPAELAMTAVGLQMAIEITRHVDYAIRWSVNVEIDMVSIQRLLEYSKLEPEIEKGVKETQVQLDSKPFEGKIEFTRVEMRYGPELPPALKSLSFTI